jgi:hypothetical protein
MSTPIENSRKHGPFDPRFLPRPDRLRIRPTGSNGSIHAAEQAGRLQKNEGGVTTKAA